MHTTGELKVFAGSSGVRFAQAMCQYLGVKLGRSETIQFSEGNTFVRIGETVRDKDVYLVQPIGLSPNDDLVEIMFWMDAFQRAGAGMVTLILPYFGYAKGDKKDEPRVSIRARVCAEGIEAAGADRVVCMDLHAPQIQGFFKKPVIHLFARPILCEYVKTLQVENLVVVSPDAGFAKDARRFADYLGCSVAIGDKARYAHDEKAEVLEIIGEVAGKNCLVVDDFTISGGTLVNLARGLKRRGAGRIMACLSHNVVTGAGVARLDESPIERVIVTDSLYNPNACGHAKFEVLSVAPLFAEAVARMHEGEAVSPLYQRVPDRVIQRQLTML
ncbi:MAG: ribose-phosphate diphosphokinase [Christensenellales bacterium]|jgi:ribose-phosphate pyrophosphokinase